MAKIERILQFLEDLFQADGFPDYSHAMNGYQVQGPEEVERVVAAVDASEATILEAARRNADLLVVHHGLFWSGLGPLTGPRFRRVAALIEGRLGLYSLHLPLDAHPVHGNSAILARELGFEPEGTFASFQGVHIGCWTGVSMKREELRVRLAAAVQGEARVLPGGPEKVKRVGVVTGGGSSALGEAAAMGLDSLVTGEAPHHAYHEAMELGVNLFLGGHYATETFGVRSLARALAEEFGVAWEFIHLPTGL